MKVVTIKITRKTDLTKNLYLPKTTLQTPFHPFHAKEAESCYEAYRQWLRDVVLSGDDSVKAAHRIADQRGLLISQRWQRSSRESMLATLADLAKKSEVTILVAGDKDPAHCLASYLRWRHPEPKQTELECV